MQVTLGIKHSTRELTLETSASQNEILSSLANAATANITLSDDRSGRPSPGASASASETAPAGAARVP